MTKRASTWNVQEGLGLLRWGDSHDTIRALFPKATAKGGYESRHPLTGDVIKVAPSPLIEGLVVTPNGVRLDAQCTLDDRGQLESLFLTVQDLPHGTSAQSAAASVADLFGVGPVTTRTEQSFERGLVQVDLGLHEDEFTFTVSRLD